MQVVSIFHVIRGQIRLDFQKPQKIQSIPPAQQVKALVFMWSGTVPLLKLLKTQEQ